MHLESISRPGGPASPLAAAVASTETGSVRSNRRVAGGVEAGAAQAEKQEEPASRPELDRLVEEANANLKVLNEKLGFQVHEGTGQIVVQIVNRENGEVVRESPPKEFLDLAARMKEMVGLFLDERG